MVGYYLFLLHVISEYQPDFLNFHIPAVFIDEIFGLKELVWDGSKQYS